MTALARQLIAQHDMLVLSDYAKGALERVEVLIAAAREAGVPVLVDPKGHLYQRYRGATVITPNRSEMQDAVGRRSEEHTSELQSLMRISYAVFCLKKKKKKQKKKPLINNTKITNKKRQ